MDIGFTAWAALASLYALTVALGARRLRALRADATRAQAALTAQRDARTDTADAATRQAAELTTLHDTVRALEAARDDAQRAQKLAQRAATDTATQYIQCQDTLARTRAEADAERKRLTSLSDALSTALTDAQRSFNSERARVNGLSQSEASLNQRIRALEDALNQSARDKEALYQQIAQAQDALTSQQQRVCALEGTASQLASEKEALSKQVTQLTAALASAQHAAQTANTQTTDAARLQAHREAALNQHMRELEAQVAQLTAALASAQRAAQAANAPTPDAARLQAHREAALNQRVRALEDALQEAHNRAAQAEAHEGSAAQLQQHIHDLKAKLQALRERERAILKVMQEEVAALNETASRAYARGLVEGVCIDGVISPTEKARVDQWFANNGFPAEWAQRLFQEVQEQYDAQWLASDDPAPPSSDAPAVVSDPAPADKTARLRDLIAATAADGLISYEELRMLQRWAEENGVSAQALRGLLLDAKRAHPGALLIQSSPRALSNKEKGDAFEQYVVSRFSGKHFKLLDWRGDKVTAEGKFALASMLPDLELALCLGNEQHRFAVECKWRSNIGPEGEVTWCREEQLARYRAFEARRGEPVFLVLGLGGMPQEPHGVFAIPLRDLSSPTIGREQLGRYRHDPAKPFYYSPEQRALR